ncbi:MAG: ferrous iron transport protein B [Marinilabiliales bacterium]|nr:MAG: ferrous iron transport protein B [Marinilabiliales bacterium]
MTLADLKNGEKAIISKVKGRGAFRKRIIEMGFVVGKQVIVIKNAPLKDPIEYNIMGYEVSLRRTEASLIEVHTDYIKPKLDEDFASRLQLEESLNIIKINRTKTINVALVGNPNCGKTTLFNHASHSHEQVGNYGGITVDAKKAVFKYKDYKFNIVDLPGTYSLTSYTPEELYVRDHIIKEVPDIILNVIDTSNLERNLYLTTQLIDMDIKVIIALNMWDEFKLKGDKFDYETLGKMIGMPMVPLVASKGTGLNEIFDKIITAFEDKEPIIRHIHINYGRRIEMAIKSIQEKINIPGNEVVTSKIAPRFLAIKLLEQDEKETERISLCKNENEIREIAAKESEIISKLRNENPETIFTDAKYGFIEGALKETYKKSNIKEKISRSRIIDKVLTGRLLSYPVFLLAMWVMFQTTFLLGDYPMQWIEKGVAFLGDILVKYLPEGMFRDMLVDGLLGGVGGVIVFLPNILILFFFITLMEASGYMARVAFIVDKLMHKIGLHGKSFVPMLMGFGCNVPAIMATRTIESKTDRLKTMLIIPFMSCSARYPVYILIITAFFDNFRGTILFGIYMFGIFLAAFIAWVMKKTLFKVETIPFVMELPPYRVPALTSILKQTWFKGQQYIKKMGTIILVGSLIVWALGYFPLNNDIEQEYNSKISKLKEEQNNYSTSELNNKIKTLQLEKESLKQEKSFIGYIGKFMEPVIFPLGFDWKMGVSLLAGSSAKEIIISTMGVLYQTDIENNEKSLVEKLQTQRYTRGKRKGQLVFSQVVAMSYLVFILIYFPCLAVIAAIKNESGKWKWSLFLAFYTTALAWIASFAVYQIGNLLT